MRERRFKQPLRYAGHDYHAPCSVHVTICTWRRQRLFGEVARDGVVLSDAGQFAESVLLALDTPANGVDIDTHVVMPDHLHAIIHLGTHPFAETTASIPDQIRVSNVRVVKFWPRGVRQRGWPHYDTHLWQQSYFDTLIRNDAHLESTRQYILRNPARWIERNQP